MKERTIKLLKFIWEGLRIFLLIGAFFAIPALLQSYVFPFDDPIIGFFLNQIWMVSVLYALHYIYAAYRYIRYGDDILKNQRGISSLFENETEDINHQTTAECHNPETKQNASNPTNE